MQTSQIKLTADKRRRMRGRAFAAMGLVEKIGANRFKVATPSLRGRRTNYFVAGGNCSCLEFEEYAAANPDFKCEHLIAVEIFNENL